MGVTDFTVFMRKTLSLFDNPDEIAVAIMNAYPQITRPTPTVPQEVREALEFYAGDCGDGGKRAFEALKAIGLLANPVEDRDGNDG